MQAALVGGLLTAAATHLSAQEVAERAGGVVLRGLDRLDGRTVDVTMTSGTRAQVLGLTVELADCRVPAENPSGDAYAYLVVRDRPTGPAQFAGWMVASAPALNALDHARYDIWVLRCITS